MELSDTGSRRTGVWVLLGLGILFLLGIVFLTPLGDYLGASVTMGPDRGSSYTPLVRSQQSLNHKYDIGTDACEQDVTITKTEKEYTVGYLFAQRPAGLSVQPLYGCHEANTPKCAKEITPNLDDCKAMGKSYFGLGFVARETNFEAAVPLVKCTNAEADDTLLTNDTRECQLAGYEGAVQLGYVASAGYLPLRSLTELCEAVRLNCPSSNPSALCTTYRAACRFGASDQTAPPPVNEGPKAHISYFEGGVGLENLKYATNGTGSWVTTRIDELGYVGIGSSLAVDSQKKVHVGYHYSPVDNDLKYATNASGSWVTTTVDTAAVGQQIALAVDAQDKAHIVYSVQQKAKYATNVSGSWIKVDVPNVRYCYSIAIDRQGKAHLACASTNPGTGKEIVQYVTNAPPTSSVAPSLSPSASPTPSGGWTVTEVDSPASVGTYSPHPSLKLDGQGKAHISYLLLTGTTPNRQLKYATNSSGSWVKSVVDATVDFTDGIGHTTSLGLDPQGKAHISYLDKPDSLRYATNASGSWVATTVDANGQVGKYNSIAVDGNGKLYISYYDAANSDLKYATNVSGSWVVSVADSSGEVGSWTSIGVSP